MLQFADCLPIPSELVRLGVTKAELARMRGTRYDLMMAMFEGVPADDLGSGTHLEYINYNYPDQYNLGLTQDNPPPKILAARIRQYLDANPTLDGLELDCPFDNNPMQVIAVQKVLTIVKACPDDIIMPNFGDAATWMGVNLQFRMAAMELYQMCRWHLVEVAVDLSRPFDGEKWKRVRGHIENAIDVDGKRIVAGIYDPGMKQSQLAYSLAATIQHPRVWWWYKGAFEPNYDEQWNPWYDELGWR